MHRMVARVRFRAAGRDRVEQLEVEGAQWSLGSGPEATVRVHHRAVAPLHAEVLLRRDRFIVRPAGHGTVAVDGHPIRAPRVLAPGETFTLGDLALSVTPAPGPPIAVLAEGAARELDWPEPGRRFLLAAGGELAWAPADPTWATAMEAGAAAGPGLAEAAFVGAGRWREALPPGVRLAELMARLAWGDLGLPPEVAVAVLGQLAEALTTLHAGFGPHGALTPDFIHLGERGQVLVVRPPPGLRAPEPWLSPEGRFGAAPSVEDDAFALASLGVSLLRATGAPSEAYAPLTPLLQSDPGRRATDLQAATETLRRRVEGAGLDATAAHLARPVRLLLGERTQPLLTRGPDATPER